MSKESRAFSLEELIIAIAIVVILTAIAIPLFLNPPTIGDEEKENLTIDALRVYLKGAYIKHGFWDLQPCPLQSLKNPPTWHPFVPDPDEGRWMCRNLNMGYVYIGCPYYIQNTTGHRWQYCYWDYEVIEANYPTPPEAYCKAGDVLLLDDFGH